MATIFQWSGKTAKGTIESGEMTAASKDDVITQLRRRNIVATVVNEKTKKPGGFSFGAKRVKDKDIVVFTRQFATMIDAGLPLVQALDILSTQVENKTLSKTLQQVKSDVESGATYADALKKHPRVFTELYVNMVAAGEAGGILDTILNRLAHIHRKSHEDQEKGQGRIGLSCSGIDDCRFCHRSHYDLCGTDLRHKCSLPWEAPCHCLPGWSSTSVILLPVQGV